MIEFTVFSQYSFFVQFVITFVVTAYLYTKYKTDWLPFERHFFSFFLFITLSNFIAIFFIIDQGLEFSFVNIFSFLSLVFLLMAGQTLMGVRNKVLLYVIPILIFVIDTTMNLLEGMMLVTPGIYRAVTGIDSLLIVIPSMIIYSYLTYKTKDISLAFFVLALVFYMVGGLTVGSLGEVGMATFFILAVICFALATTIPILRNRLHEMAPPAKSSS